MVQIAHLLISHTKIDVKQWTPGPFCQYYQLQAHPVNMKVVLLLIYYVG